MLLQHVKTGLLTRSPVLQSPHMLLSATVSAVYQSLSLPMLTMLSVSADCCQGTEDLHLGPTAAYDDKGTVRQPAEAAAHPAEEPQLTDGHPGVADLLPPAAAHAAAAVAGGSWGLQVAKLLRLKIVTAAAHIHGENVWMQVQHSNWRAAG